MSSSRETLFQILCVGASLILLVVSLLYGVRVTALNQQAAAAKTKVESLREEVAAWRRKARRAPSASSRKK